MRSDYEIRVIRELKKGKYGLEEISRKTKVPKVVVEVIARHYSDADSEAEDGKRLRFTKSTASLLLDILMLYLALRLIIALMGW